MRQRIAIASVMLTIGIVSAARATDPHVPHIPKNPYLLPPKASAEKQTVTAQTKGRPCRILTYGSRAGFHDGAPTDVRFRAPYGVASGSGAQIYVADQRNHRVRLIKRGRVSAYAGDGTTGLRDGPALKARFSRPTAVAVDAKQRVYVADLGNRRIRRIAKGSVTTIAGDGTAGFADGPALKAQFKSPASLVVDGSGSVYISDLGNHRIRRLAGGKVSTFAGSGTAGLADGPSTQAQFNQPVGIAIGPDGALYVADMGNHAIRRIADGRVTTVAGGEAGRDDGPLKQARFRSPTSVAVDTQGRIYVADASNRSIRIIGRSRVGSVLCPNRTLKFSTPTGVAITKKQQLVVADMAAHWVQVITR